jgi:hypothetical protein
MGTLGEIGSRYEASKANLISAIIRSGVSPVGFVPEVPAPQMVQAGKELAGAIPAGLDKEVTAVPGPAGGPIRPETATADLLRSYGLNPLVPETWQVAADAIAKATGLRIPIGSLARFIAGPEGASLALDLPVGELASGIGAAKIPGATRTIGEEAKILGSMIGEPIRATKIGKAIEAVSQGGGVPAKIEGVAAPNARETLRGMLMDAYGEKAVRDAALQEAIRPIEQTIKDTAKARGISEVAQAKRLRDAVEELPRLKGAATEGFTQAERDAVAAMTKISRATPRERLAAGLRPFELGGHVPPLAKNVEAAVAKFEAEKAGLQTLKEIGPRGAKLKSQIAKAKGEGVAAREELARLARVASTKATAKAELGGVDLLQELGSGRAATRLQTNRANRALAEAEQALSEAKIPKGEPHAPIVAERAKAARDAIQFADEKIKGLSALAKRDRSVARQIERVRVAKGEAVQAIKAFEAKSGIRVPRRGEAEVAAGLRPPENAPKIELKAAARVARNYRRRMIAHTPRESTEALRALSTNKYVRERPYGGGGIPRGLTTKIGKRRVSLPVTATKEIERRLAPHLGKEEAFAPVTEGYLKSGYRTNRAIAHIDLANNVARTFGRATEEAPKDWVELGSLSGLKAGAMKETIARLNTIKVHPRIFDTLEAVSKNLEPQNYGKIQAFANSVVRIVKPLYTVVNPGFVVRNQIWNVMVTASRGNRDLTAWTRAADVLSKTAPDETLAGFKVTKATFLKQAIEDSIVTEAGVTSGEFGTRVGRRIGETQAHWLRTYPEWMSRANSVGENTARLSHYIWSLERGMTRAQARLEVARTLFNYSRDAFTVLENQARQYILFYSWYRRIYPLTLRTALERPGEIAKFATAVNNINAMQGVAPIEAAYLAPSYFDAVGIVLPPSDTQPEGTRRVILSNAYGFGDVTHFIPERAQVAGAKPLGAGQEFAVWLTEQLRPEITTVAQLVFSKTLLYDSELDGTAVPLPAWAAFIPKSARNVLGIEINKDSGRAYGPNWLPIMFGVVGAAPGNLTEAARGLFLGDRVSMNRAIGWASGIRVEPAAEPQRMMGMEALRERTVARQEKSVYRKSAIIEAEAEYRRRLQEEALGGRRSKP